LIGLAILISLLRYVGLIFILTIFLWLWRKRNTYHAFIFLVISIIPIILWISRNYFLFDTLTGGHTNFILTIPKIELLSFVLSPISQWISPFVSLKKTWLDLAFGGFFLALSFILVWKKSIFRINLRQTYFTETLYVVLYLVILFAVVRTSYPYGNFNLVRILSPIFPYLMVGTIWMEQYVFQKYQHIRVYRVGFILCYGIWVFQTLRNTLTHLWVRQFGAVDFSILEFIKHQISIWLNLF